MKENYILIIETSETNCSVAISSNGKIIQEINDDNANNNINNAKHSELIGKYIEKLLENIKGKIKAVAVNYGPGSYTGLRIGMSIAKGLCYAWKAKLITVDALKPLVDKTIEIIENKTEKCKLIPMIDARRMEVYTAIYNQNGERESDIKPMIIEENSFNEINEKIYVFGSGAEKIKGVIKKNINYIEVKTSAINMAKIANEMFEKSEFANIAYSEPLYIKEWQPQINFQKKL